jgi:hypothetical protein
LLAGHPADQPAFLVGHQQQRHLHRALRLRLPQLRDHPGDLGLAGDVLAEEDDPGHLPVADVGEQARRRRQAGIGADDPLPGELGVSQAGRKPCPGVPGGRDRGPRARRRGGYAADQRDPETSERLPAAQSAARPAG